MGRGQNRLRNSDFKDVSSLSTKLQAKADSGFRLPIHQSLQFHPPNPGQQPRGGGASVTAARVALMQDLNNVVLKQSLYSPERFSGITLQESTKQLLSQDPKVRNEPRLNRMLLADAYPKELAYQNGRRELYQPIRRQAGVVWICVFPAGTAHRRSWWLKEGFRP